MQTIQNWDKWLFGVINDGFPSKGLDPIAIFLSSSKTWWVSIGVFLCMSFLLRKKRWIQGVVVGALALGVSDLVSSQVLKPTFKRVRPCHELTVQLRSQNCGSTFGLPSNHAGNGAAFFSASRFFLPLGVSAWVGIVAFLVGWSRVYLGVHYPGDVLLGLFVGGSIGFFIGWISIKLGSYRRT